MLAIALVYLLHFQHSPPHFDFPPAPQQWNWNGGWAQCPTRGYLAFWSPDRAFWDFSKWEQFGKEGQNSSYSFPLCFLWYRLCSSCGLNNFRSSVVKATNSEWQASSESIVLHYFMAKGRTSALSHQCSLILKMGSLLFAFKRIWQLSNQRGVKVSYGQSFKLGLLDSLHLPIVKLTSLSHVL